MGAIHEAWGTPDPEVVRLIHDLNNALQTVLVNTEFVAASTQAPQVRVDALEANEAARQAARLARELARRLSQPRAES
jgi:hypothetical protein